MASTKRFGASDPSLMRYVVGEFAPEDPMLREIRERSAREGLPQIQVGEMDALHLEVLARAAGARSAVEIGTLAGYSGLALLRGMGAQGRLYTFEADPKHAAVARESFQKAGVSQQVEQFVGPALRELPQIEGRGPFDLVFIDADKASYPKYLDWAAKNLRVGGVVLGDNTFAWGMIAEKNIDDPEDLEAVTALRAFNHQAAQGGRFRSTILPTGEGLTLAVKLR